MLKPGTAALLSLLLLSGLAGCASEGSPTSSFGLPSYEFAIEDDLVPELSNGASAKVDVPARLRTPDGDRLVKIEAAGASTIQAVKKSLDVKFEAPGAGEESPRELRLGSTLRDPSMLKALLSTEIFAASGLPTPAAEPVVVFVNGRYYGLYIQLERIDPAFFRRRGQELSSLAKSRDARFGPGALSRIDESFDAAIGTEALERVRDLARAMLEPDDSSFGARALGILDRASLTRYLAASVLTNHWDGFNKNLHLTLLRGERTLGIAPWDLDQDWSPDWNTDAVVWHTNHLFSRLSSLPEIRAEIASHLRLLRSTVARPEAIAERIGSWSRRIGEAYAADPILGGRGLRLEVEAEKLRKEIERWLRHTEGAFG